MPAIDSFGKATDVISMPCPLCENPSVVRKFKTADSRTNDWIVCPVQSCSYEATFREFRATIEIEVPLTCPDCGHKTMVRKTKDIYSRYLGLVKCMAGACTYEANFEDFDTTKK